MPITNLLGQEGRGFAQLMQQLPQERLVVAIRCATALEAALDETIRYTKGTQGFWKKHIRFPEHTFQTS